MSNFLVSKEVNIQVCFFYYWGGKYLCIDFKQYDSNVKYCCKQIEGYCYSVMYGCWYFFCIIGIVMALWLVFLGLFIVQVVLEDMKLEVEESFLVFVVWEEKMVVWVFWVVLGKFKIEMFEVRSDWVFKLEIIFGWYFDIVGQFWFLFDNKESIWLLFLLFGQYLEFMFEVQVDFVFCLGGCGFDSISLFKLQ